MRFDDRPPTIAVLMPVTRTTFLRDALMSLAAQESLPDVIVMLANGLNDEELERVHEILEEASALRLQGLVTFCRVEKRCLTSEACALLVRNCHADYAFLLADDDLLPANFVSAVRSKLMSMNCEAVLTSPLESFSEDTSQLAQQTQIVEGFGGSTVPAIVRWLAGLVGLVSGGGTIFPVEAARRWGVFESPIPVILEDQLMSTRLLRRLPLVLLRDTTYLYRIHGAQSDSDPRLATFAKGVVRHVRIAEEGHPLLRALNSAGIRLDLDFVPSDLKATYYAGYLAAGGSRRVFKTVDALPHIGWARHLARLLHRLVSK
jgi:hypothetical protein